MTDTLTLISFDATLRDRYPAPGERIKQYVVDERREDAWADATCPTVSVIPHQTKNFDGEDVDCVCGDVQWHRLDNGCQVCVAVQAATRDIDRVRRWLAEMAARPPICADRDKLSDEVAPEWHFDGHPLLAKLARRRGKRS